MMSLVSMSLNCPHPPMRHRPSRKKLRDFMMNISDDQLYEDMLKSGEVVL